MAMDTSPDLPGVAAAGDGILHALWTLLAAQLSCLAKEAWLRASVDIAANTAFAHGMADDRVIAVAAMESGCALLLSETLPAVGRLRVTHPDLARRCMVAATVFAVMVSEADSRTRKEAKIELPI